MKAPPFVRTVRFWADRVHGEFQITPEFGGFRGAVYHLVMRDLVVLIVHLTTTVFRCPRRLMQQCDLTARFSDEDREGLNDPALVSERCRSRRYLHEMTFAFLKRG